MKAWRQSSMYHIVQGKMESNAFYFLFYRSNSLKNSPIPGSPSPNPTTCIQVFVLFFEGETNRLTLSMTHFFDRCFVCCRSSSLLVDNMT
mmetsp:Transcript_55049/g.133737  ORF Transcript_55049/g.133737 Transcript_55049/m.133737 type:complete len:90 (-) Transcript_55049:2320-2589(-)